MRRRPTRRAVRATALLVGVALAGCSGGSGDDGDETTLTVYAAASLAEPFEELAGRFEESNDGVRVELNLAGSSDLAAQIQNGAPADVFASADEATMARLTADELAGTEPRIFATNTLQIATPRDDPAGIRSLQDLADPDVVLVLCAPEVPCGAASLALASEAGVELQPDSEEQSVTDVLGKVVSGEADAGLVYTTDVLRAGEDVRGVDVPEAGAVVNRYPIAPVVDSRHPELTRGFIDLVLSDEGQDALAGAGFGGAP